MNTLLAIDFSLPIENPVLKFLLLLIIILAAPMLFNRMKIPSLIGLIIAGIIVGPHGLGLMTRDSSIILSGTVGLLYIMFLAGLEIDIAGFKKNSSRSFVFGMFTFLIPMCLGTAAGYYLLNLSLISSILLASMLASHTLLAYPLVSKFGVSKNRAVTVAVGGTIITDTLALLVLAVIVGMHVGEVNTAFWVRMGVSLVVFVAIVFFLFPVISRWFFKHSQDNVSQYIFVLMMVFLAAVLSELAGIEAIIGAFMAGLALNKLIPSTSPLMNRVEFVGNAIFIPFFLISVGMLVDWRAFISDWETIKVAVVITGAVIIAKYLAAFFTQKLFGYTKPEREIIFGLSIAQAAATLATVMVGHSVGLLNDAILNGAIVKILVTCTIASFQTQKGAFTLSIMEGNFGDEKKVDKDERILIPLGNPDTMEELMGLSLAIKSKSNTNGLYALNIINSKVHSSESEKKTNKLLDEAAKIASATDIDLHKIIRYDESILNGIVGVARKYDISYIVMGLHVKSDLSKSFLGDLTEGVLEHSSATAMIYKAIQPLSTIRRHLVIIPENAEKEIGFAFWLAKIWNIGRNTGAKIVFYAPESVLDIVRHIHSRHPIEADFINFPDWNDFLLISRDLRADDLLFIVTSRLHKKSYHSNMARIPDYVNQYFNKNSFILLHPMQGGILDTRDDLLNPTLLASVEKLGDVGKTLSEMIKEKG
jgi:Kef-type K+ transport system membrane component KefB